MQNKFDDYDPREVILQDLLKLFNLKEDKDIEKAYGFLYKGLGGEEDIIEGEPSIGTLDSGYS